MTIVCLAILVFCAMTFCWLYHRLPDDEGPESPDEPDDPADPWGW